MISSIAIGSDHAGFGMKEALKLWLKANHFEIEDFGVSGIGSSDYPDIAHPVATAVSAGKNRFGLLLCGSANGVAITANKHQQIRAAICWSEELASLARLHNDANVLCLPARFITQEMAERITHRFLLGSFEGGRHQRRVDKMTC
jgi:ribose 5-phosphate isomerase B